MRFLREAGDGFNLSELVSCDLVNLELFLLLNSVMMGWQTGAWFFFVVLFSW